MAAIKLTIQEVEELIHKLYIQIDTDDRIQYEIERVLPLLDLDERMSQSLSSAIEGRRMAIGKTIEITEMLSYVRDKMIEELDVPTPIRLRGFDEDL